MEQRYYLVTRNYSRKEGSEMFSLTMTREVEVESTMFRRQLENVLALYDVEVQLLNEVAQYEFVTQEFIVSRRKALLKQMDGLMLKLIEEIVTGKIDEFQEILNRKSIQDVFDRSSGFFGDFDDYYEKREKAIKQKLNK